MKTTKEQTETTSSWSELYPKVVKELIEKDNTNEQSVKERFFEKFKAALKGKDLIIENSCK